MTDISRLIERAFPLKQASLDSVHEKNVRHGHISTLHIWPARRPLAACRAALIATLLPDPGTPEGRQELCERIGGKVVKRVERKKMPDGKIVERIKEETEGGILSWIGTEPKSGGAKKKKEHQELLEQREKELQWFREEICKAYGDRAPRVLDPFAGGGAIPLEAMRLGCEATAVDINPVAWFILKCTLEYPQKLAGKTQPLPDFILDDEEFMDEFYQAHPHLVGRTKKTKKQEEADRDVLPAFVKTDSGRTPKAELAWHIRAWGRWVLKEARKELAPFYPTYADFEPLDQQNPKPYERIEMRLVPLKDDGTPDIDAINAEFSAEYLKDKRNPRWVMKPTAAYLWARTVTCKNCRATIPLLKTRWLSKKDNKRVLLTMEPNADRSGVVFGIRANVPVQGGNAAQRREFDKRVAAGTMTRSGVTCPCCGLPSMTMEDIRLEGRSNGIGTQMTAVMIECTGSREYRIPTSHELSIASSLEDKIDATYADIPYGRITEPLAPESTRSISCDIYGLDSYSKVFSPRQQLSLGHIIIATRQLRKEHTLPPGDWGEAIYRLLALNVDRVADRCSTFCRPDPTPTQSGVINTFSRFALPMTWDYIEGVPIADSSGGYLHSLEWIVRVVEHLSTTIPSSSSGTVINHSATVPLEAEAFDVILTDPPYYEAISYADLSDFFYIWQRRLNEDLPGFDGEVTDKSQETVQHVRSDKSRATEKQKYEDRMSAAFEAAHYALKADGRFGVVFAHKQPDAWETLVSAMMRAGFTVMSSWPIQTEMGNRGRAISSAALASSVWLICKKRPLTARPGWDTVVLEEMRSNITERLRAYWDAGIRGPDFVWAATGPALEAYSKHPVVKKANEPGQVMNVGEFLSHVRRMVVDFVVGRMLSGDHDSSDMAAAEQMDAPTAYYLLHRHDFGLEEAPAGACILYATACGISDRDLEATWNLIAHKGSSSATVEEDEEDGADIEEDSEDAGDDGGSTIKLKAWSQRTNRAMGYDAPSGRPVPLIDRIHRLMHLWRAGDVHKVDEYLDENGLRRHELFKRLIQSLIELAREEGKVEECQLLESLSNHLHAKGAIRTAATGRLALGEEN